jgi:hypothetical protein
VVIRPDLDQALFDFDKAWRSGPAPQVEAFLAAVQPPLSGPARREFVEELVKIDLEYRWRQAGRTSTGGKPPRLEEYAARLPDLGGVDQLALDLIGEEYRLRQARGDHPARAEYLTRFPRHATALQNLLAQIDRELASERRSYPRMYLCAPNVATSQHTPHPLGQLRGQPWADTGIAQSSGGSGVGER